jgi:hypothetical protein
MSLIRISMIALYGAALLAVGTVHAQSKPTLLHATVYKTPT